jgi:recombination protein RecR
MLSRLISIMATLPSLGPRSAKRIALHLATNKSNLMLYLSETLKELYDKITFCEICNNIDEVSPCKICSNESRDRSKICTVETIDDIFQIEGSGHYKGLYHVVGKPDDHPSPSSIDVGRIIKRVENEGIKELILANSPTLNGQTIMFYIAEAFEQACIKHRDEFKITILGRGLPIGSEIDYLDEGTILAAFESRKNFTNN